MSGLWCHDAPWRAANDGEGAKEEYTQNQLKRPFCPAAWTRPAHLLVNELRFVSRVRFAGFSPFWRLQE